MIKSAIAAITLMLAFGVASAAPSGKIGRELGVAQ